MTSRRRKIPLPINPVYTPRVVLILPAPPPSPLLPEVSTQLAAMPKSINAHWSPRTQPNMICEDVFCSSLCPLKTNIGLNSRFE